jgi:hypothetical protein
MFRVMVKNQGDWDEKKRISRKQTGSTLTGRDSYLQHFIEPNPHFSYYVISDKKPTVFSRYRKEKKDRLNLEG